MPTSIFSLHSTQPAIRRQAAPEAAPAPHKAPETIDHSAALRGILNRLNQSTTDILSSALVSMDGLIIASSVMITLDEEVIGAMSSAMLGIGSRVSEQFRRGALDQVLVHGEEGYVVITRASDNSVLSVITNQRAKLGLIFMECKQAAQALTKCLAEIN
jgi:hypothetical protein